MRFNLSRRAVVARAAAVGLVAVAGVAAGARADLSLSTGAKELTLTEGLAIRGVSKWGRRAINQDPVADAMVRGTLGHPKDGDAFATGTQPSAAGDKSDGKSDAKGDDADAPTGPRWRAVKANDKGQLPAMDRGAYVLCTVQSEADRVMLLSAVGDGLVYVNGEPHAGDPYSNGKLHLPVALKKGENQFLFAHAGRGPMKATLAAADAPAVVLTDDLTLPDVLSDKPTEYWIGVPVLNASATARTLIVSTQAEGEGAAVREERIAMPPLTGQKAALRVMAASTKDKADVTVTITLRDAADDKTILGTPAKVTLRARSPEQVHLRTYVSAVDGSVQYCAITPQRTEGKIEHPALVLSLHGASVEASGQAPCYDPKPDMVVVCPTNRRPYGFDWEDWGRVDAVEAMENAKVWFNTDPRRQYLTGHSMGGHGTWQLGVLLSDRFAAIGPSAGWLSFETYASQRGEPTETTETQLRAMFKRAGSSSDTLALMPNLRGKGIYILHGDADDNVPVTEARRASEELTKLDIPFEYHEEPGVSHWWDKDGPGVACVDWPPMFEMFRTKILPAPGEKKEWHARALLAGVALPPGDGVRIDRAQQAGKLATADVVVDSAAGRISITTSNVAAITLGSQVCGDASACAFEIDGKPAKASKHGTRVSVLKLPDGRWVDASELPGSSAAGGFEGVPVGPFKNAFNKRFVEVYGTKGTPEENAWSLARARYDAEQWWYRGNGRAVLLSDDEFLKRLDAGEMGSNAILYGNTASNAAAARLLPGGAVSVGRGSASVGGRTLEGDDLGVLGIGTFATSERSGDKTTRMYAVIGGTGLPGMRATDRMLYLQSGVGIPDVCVIRGDLWSKGTQGIECAGFLGPAMGMEESEIIWRDTNAAHTSK